MLPQVSAKSPDSPIWKGIRASPLALPKGPPNAIWGHRRRKSCPVAPPCGFFHPARRMFSFGAPDPNPVHGGATGGAGWARGSPRGPLSAARLMFHRLHLSRLPCPVMALQTTTVLQRRSKPSHWSTRRREMNAMPRASRPFPSLLLRFPTLLPVINRSSPRR
jgi:hypothetical protein